MQLKENIVYIYIKLSWIWLPLTTTAHHPGTTSPIMHCTHTFPSTITPITQLSPFTHQPWLPHHTCTSFTHSHKSSTQTLTQCEVLFPPWLHFRAYFPVCLSVLYLDCWPPLLIVCCLPLWPHLFYGNPLCLPPALTHCSASVFDSAFSTLPPIPLLDICLFDLVQIKLLVDLLSPLTCHLLHKYNKMNLSRT